MKQNTINIPQAALIPASTMIHQENGNITQLVFIEKHPTQSRTSSGTPHHSQQTPNMLDLPIGKALRGSVVYLKDPSDHTGNTIAQQINLYRSNGKKYSTSIHDTRYSHVKVSQSRITVSMSFPLGDDPTRLKARMQNFANIIIDESDEIAAMLNQEGDARVFDAWELLANSSLENADATV